MKISNGVDKIKKIIAKIKPLDKKAMQTAKKRLDNLTKPLGSLGKLEEIAERISGIRGKIAPVIRQKTIFVLAGDHGVVMEGVSAYPSEVTSQMVYNFVKGGAGINVLAKHIGARLLVADMGVAAKLKPGKKIIDKKIAFGTKNMAKGPAMTREQALKAINVGIKLVEKEITKGIDIIGAGDMGIGNTTASSAITAVITKEKVEKVVGRGTGIGDAALKRKIKIIQRAIKINRPDPKDPIDVLAKVGGLEIAGLVGIILAGAANRIPVVLDGFIVGAAGLIACELAPQARNYLFASHRSVENGHKVILKKIKLDPILNLNLRLGEGTGAALAISIIEAATKIINEMATFEEAFVSKKL